MSYVSRLSDIAMPASFPAGVYEPREIENVPGQTYDESKKTRLYADDINNSNAEIIAIEERLGENPQGVFSTVVERLNDVDTKALLGNHVYLETLAVDTDPINLLESVSGFVEFYFNARVHARATMGDVAIVKFFYTDREDVKTIEMPPIDIYLSGTSKGSALGLSINSAVGYQVIAPTGWNGGSIDIDIACKQVSLLV